jgi:hypothetical protein
MTRIARFLVGAVLLLLCLVVAGPSATASDTDVTGGRDDRLDGAPVTVRAFRLRSSFASDKEYGKYVEKTLRVGWRVRAAVDYEKVKKGMTGTYYGTNGGVPPCLIIWDKDLQSGSVLLPNVPANKATHAYWVYWDAVDIIVSSP